MSANDNTSFSVRHADDNFEDHSIDDNDSIVIYSANHIQATYLPEAFSVPAGRTYTIVNASSSTLTVLSTEQLDGVPGGSRTPVDFHQVISDGANWFTLGFR